MDDLKTRFGHLLAAHRKRLGLTQEQLATRCDLSVETIKKLEAGRQGARFAVVEEIARGLDVDPAALFSSEPSSFGNRRSLNDLVAELATMSDAELTWVREVLAVARRRP